MGIDKEEEEEEEEEDYYYYGTVNRGSNPDSCKIYVPYTASRRAMETTHPPVHWIPAAPSPVAERHRREVDHSPHLMPRLGLSVATPSLPHTPSWRVRKQLYLYIYDPWKRV
jgi:hypothetical protein